MVEGKKKWFVLFRGSCVTLLKLVYFRRWLVKGFVIWDLDTGFNLCLLFKDILQTLMAFSCCLCCMVVVCTLICVLTLHMLCLKFNLQGSREIILPILDAYSKIYLLNSMRWLHCWLLHTNSAILVGSIGKSVTTLWNSIHTVWAWYWWYTTTCSVENPIIFNHRVAWTSCFVKWLFIFNYEARTITVDKEGLVCC